MQTLDTLDLAPTSALLKALADDTRLRMIALLSRGELCVCHLVSALDIQQPNASQHLSALRSAGLVEGRRHGSWIHYRLRPQEDAARAKLVDALIAGFEAKADALDDLRRLAVAKTGIPCE